MEFHEKLKQLRSSRSMTQEQLAQALFVSRTAISKWESGRGWPSIDSLKAISRYFSISIDDLICADEVLQAAQTDKEEALGRFRTQICAALDVLTAVLLVLPVFGNGPAPPASVPLSRLTGIRPWTQAVLWTVVVLPPLNGLCGWILTRFPLPLWSRRLQGAGIALSVAGTVVFLLTRQPYAGLVFLAVLVAKGMLLMK